MVCFTLFCTHSCFFLCPWTHECVPEPGNSCLQSIPHCSSQAMCFNGDPWQALLQLPIVPRAHYSSPCPRQAQERAFKPHIGLLFKACSRKSTDFFPPKCRLWSPASAPFSGQRAQKVSGTAHLDPSPSTNEERKRSREGTREMTGGFVNIDSD